jgi:CO/xanthine dehydrogenase Mo-binding subunit
MPTETKGLVKSGSWVVFAAIDNALYHATRRHLRSLPFTIEQLLLTDEAKLDEIKCSEQNVHR